MPKSILFLFSILLFSPSVQGQTNWLKHYGSGGNDEIFDVCKGQNGDIYFTGYFSNQLTMGGQTLNSIGTEDVIIGKADTLGNIIWILSGGGQGADQGNSIAIDNSGNIYVGGFFTGTANFGNQQFNSNAQDYFISKINPNGQFLWTITGGGNDFDEVLALTVDLNSNVIATGEFKGTGQIGGSTFSSGINPSTGLPSYDLFILQVNSSGIPQWSIQGSGKYDDRGLDLDVDNLGNIYLAGQFSDTFQLGSNIINNSVMNSGLVVKFSNNGSMTWYRKLSGTHCRPSCLKVKSPNELILSGDFKGNLQWFSNPSSFSNNSFIYKYFVASVNGNGNLNWISNGGSDNEIGIRCMDFDSDGSIYLGGFFKCTMSQFNQIHGQTCFRSVGFKDILVMKYNGSGLRTWERNFGGANDDWCGGIVAKNVNKPLVFGSFGLSIHARLSTSTPLHPNHNYTIANYLGGSYNYGCFLGSYFGYNNQNSFATDGYLHSLSNGLKDFLLSSPIDTSIPLYNYFINNTTSSASNTILPDFIENNSTNIGTDTLHTCNHPTQLTYNIRQFGQDRNCNINYPPLVVGPEFNFNWSNGQNQWKTYTQQNGLIWCSATSEDGCYQFTDSLVIVFDTISLVLDDNFGNEHSSRIYYERIPVCPGEELKLWPRNVNSNEQINWFRNNLPYYTGDTLLITEKGKYKCQKTSNNGCIISVYFEICYDTLVDHISLNDLKLNLFDSNNNLWDSDTLEICYLDTFWLHLIDSTDFPILGDKIPCKMVKWSILDGNIDNFCFVCHLDPDTTWDFHKNAFVALDSGYQTIQADLINTCGGDYSVLSISRTFYQATSTIPRPIILGVAPFCSGDSLQLIGVGSGGDFTWTYLQPNLSFYQTNDTAYFSLPGQIELEESYEFPNGCTVVKNATSFISHADIPIVFALPQNGYICPNDSVKLWVEPALTYEWIGPNGDVISHTQFVYATTPGNYYCNIQTFSGCILSSNNFEVKGYNSPYLLANPGNYLCGNDSIRVEVIASSLSILAWNDPSLDTNSIVFIHDPGTYSCQATFCGISETVSITIFPSPDFPSLHLIGNDSICPSDTVQIEVLGNYLEINWNTGEAGNGIFVSDSGNFFCTATDQNGCSLVSDTLSISFNPHPSNPIITNDTAVCKYSTFILEVQNPSLQVNWYHQMPFTNPFHQGATYQINSIQTDDVIYVVQSDGFCSSGYSQINITILPSISSIPVNGDFTLCKDQPLSLRIQEQNGMLVNWSFGNTFLSDSTVLVWDHPTTGIVHLEYGLGNCPPYQMDLSVWVDSTVNPVISVSPSEPFCQGDSVELSLFPENQAALWSNGMEGNRIFIFTIGSYSAQIISQMGCELRSDTVEIDFRTRPLSTSLSDTVICGTNQFSLDQPLDSLYYLWNAPTLDSIWFSGNSILIPSFSSGSLLVTVKTFDGFCESSIDSFNLSYQQGIALEWLSFDTLLCPGDSLFLEIQNNPTQEIEWLYHNSLVSQDFSLHFQPTVSDSIQLVVSNQICPADTITIPFTLIEAQVLHPISYPENLENICEGSFVQLSILDPGIDSVVWSPSQVNNPVLAVFQNGVYFAQVFKQNGCMFLSDSIIVNFNPLPEAPQFEDSMFCSGNSISYFLPDSLNPSWFVDGTINNSQNLVLTNLQNATTIQVLVTNSNGCQDISENWNLTPVLLQPMEGFVTNEVICSGRPFSIFRSGDISLSSFWITPMEDTIPASVLQVFEGINQNQGDYYLLESVGNCWQIMDTVEISLQPTPIQPTIGNKLTFCSADSVFLVDHTNFSNQDIWIDWNGISYAGDSINLGQIGEEGSYEILAYRDSMGCFSDTLVKTIIIKPSPVYTLLNDTTICYGVGFPITINHSGWNIYWQDSLEQNSFFVNDTGLITLRIENQYHCELTDSVYIFSYDCNPDSTNIFTPNGDGINDFFEFTQNGTTCEEVHIYNRYGIEVASWDESWGLWDGTIQNNGSPAEAGIYFYTAYFCRADGYSYELTGFVLLIR
jgi:gliding motility-associated-like protein